MRFRPTKSRERVDRRCRFTRRLRRSGEQAFGLRSRSQATARYAFLSEGKERKGKRNGKKNSNINSGLVPLPTPFVFPFSTRSLASLKQSLPFLCTSLAHLPRHLSLTGTPAIFEGRGWEVHQVCVARRPDRLLQRPFFLNFGVVEPPSFFGKEESGGDPEGGRGVSLFFQTADRAGFPLL